MVLAYPRDIVTFEDTTTDTTITHPIKSRLMNFATHTRIRRLRLMTYWTVEDIVYGAFGPISATSTDHAKSKHIWGIDDDALSLAVDQLRPILHTFYCNRPLDFEDLYQRVKNAIYPISGIGLLVVYDIALRIGCSLCPRIIPEKYVYLHGYGSRVYTSANAILHTNIKKQYGTIDAIDVAHLQPYFPCYSAMEIEDLLCIYHDQIVNNGRFDPDWLKELPEGVCDSDEAGAQNCDCCSFS